MNPLISVIIPVYNRPHELLLTLQSIHDQTYRPLEIIMVDDGSSPEIATWKKQIENRIGDIPFVLNRQVNQGAPAARNKGFQLSKGEYVIFWDADIIAQPSMLQRMQEALTTHEQASFAYSSFYFGNKKMPSQMFDGSSLKEKNYITTTSLIRRKDFFGFDTRLKRFQDWDLWLSLLEQKKEGIWIPDFLFQILPQGTMSNWLPAFAYRSPWKFFPFLRKKVKAYEEAKKIIVAKHHL